MSELAQLAAQFGFPALIAVLIFLAYRSQTDQIVGVVKNNTEAISKLCSEIGEIYALLNKHDTRAERVEGIASVINERTVRIEDKINRHDEYVKGKLS